jgi:hypothetical protein
VLTADSISAGSAIIGAEAGERTAPFAPASEIEIENESLTGSCPPGLTSGSPFVALIAPR